MKLSSMWYAINSSDIERSTKYLLFVGVNVFLWTAVALALCLAGGAVIGSFGGKWGFWTFIITGYSAVIMGFFRSVFYLFKQK